MAKTKDKSLGSIIKQYRILKGLTQEELAESLNLSYQQVQKYEYNTAVPPLDKLSLISKILEIPAEAFFKENVRHDLLQKIELEIEKNFEIIEIIKKSPELQEIIKYYSKQRQHLKDIDVLKVLKTLASLPKSKRDSYLNTLNEISLLAR